LISVVDCWARWMTIQLDDCDPRVRQSHQYCRYPAALMTFQCHRSVGKSLHCPPFRAGPECMCPKGRKHMQARPSSVHLRYVNGLPVRAVRTDSGCATWSWLWRKQACGGCGFMRCGHTYAVRGTSRFCLILSFLGRRTNGPVDKKHPSDRRRHLSTGPVYFLEHKSASLNFLMTGSTPRRYLST
jgi:hypothetical protein